MGDLGAGEVYLYVNNVLFGSAPSDTLLLEEIGWDSEGNPVSVVRAIVTASRSWKGTRGRLFVPL